MRTRAFVVIATASIFYGPPSAGATTSQLHYGLGPQSHYAIQKQPASGTCHYRFTKAGQPLPDPKCTPGALNPKVTQSTLSWTICRSGYTSSIRPPTSVTGVEKGANARSYGYKGSLSQAEYDHLIPLELGGDPNDSRNLWVEPPSPGHSISQTFHNPKDQIENDARQLVCAHKVTLIAMQRALASNWTTALAVVGHPNATTSPGTPAHSGVPKGAPYNFSNCSALNHVFPHGVGEWGAHDHTSGSNPVTNFTRSNPWYLANSSHDRDHDHIACERH